MKSYDELRARPMGHEQLLPYDRDVGATALNSKRQDVYMSAFENAVDAQVITDMAGRELAANREARELGLSAETLLASKTHDDHVIVTDAAGAVRVLSWQERPLEGARLFVFRDVTARRHLEEAMAHSQWVESLGYLAASTGHDLNNLLTPLISTLPLLEEQVKALPEAVEMVGELRTAAEGAAALVWQLMKRIRRQPPAIDRSDLSQVVADMEPLISRGLSRDTDLFLALESTPIKVMVNRRRLETALLNLAANARDAMPRGGRITITTAIVRAGTVISGVVEPLDRDFASITVSDNGEGIPIELQRLVFERFFTTKAVTGGTGLGLSGVRSFVTDSGGHVSLSSDVGKGTTVSLYLPCE